MIIFLLIGIGVVLMAVLGFVIYTSGGRANKKPSPTVQGSSPSQSRAMGRGDN